MKAAELRKFRNALEALREEFASGRHSAKVEPNRVDAARIGQDEDEQPLNEMLQSVASGRNRNSAVTLARIEKALTKLDDDPEDFGTCEDCGDDIAPRRLEAVPYAEFCITCQAKADGPRGPLTRRKLTDYR